MKYFFSLIKILIWLCILGIVYRGEVADFFICHFNYSWAARFIYFEIFFFILFIFYFFFKKKKFSILAFYFFLLLLGIFFFVLIINLRQLYNYV